MYNNIKIKSLENDFKTISEDHKDLIEGMVLTGNDGDGTPRKFKGPAFEKDIKGFFQDVPNASAFASYVNQYITNTKPLSDADMKKLEAFYKKHGGDKAKKKRRY